MEEKEIVKEILEALKNKNFTEYITLVWQIGVFVVIVVYLKKILNAISFLLKATWTAIAGKNLDNKELFGGTCWLFFFLECAIGGIYMRKPNIEFLIFLAGFYCLMFGIDKGFDAWSNSTNKINKKDETV